MTAREEEVASSCRDYVAEARESLSRVLEHLSKPRVDWVAVNRDATGAMSHVNDLHTEAFIFNCERIRKNRGEQ